MTVETLIICDYPGCTRREDYYEAEGWQERGSRHFCPTHHCLGAKCPCTVSDLHHGGRPCRCAHGVQVR